MTRPVGERDLFPYIVGFCEKKNLDDELLNQIYNRNLFIIHPIEAMDCQMEGCHNWEIVTPSTKQDFICKCEDFFCSRHIFYENHHCTFDWFQYQKGLEEELIRIARKRKYSEIIEGEI